MSERSVHVHLLPALVDPGALAGGVVVVIDVLRASTVICAALEAGATGVRVCGEVEEARRVAGAEAGAVLGGERGGARIEGFDLGNSPEDYTAERVGGRLVVFTTTNGTRAVLHARRAGRVVVGCFANLSAVVRAVGEDGRPVHLLCAGTEGEVSLEDSLAAGVMAGELSRSGRFEAGNDSAMIVEEMARGKVGAEAVKAMLWKGRGGKNVRRLGLERDIGRCAERDWCSSVPALDQRGMVFLAR